MKLSDRVEILIDTGTVPRCSQGVVAVFEPDGCFVEFSDDEGNTIDVLSLHQRHLALAQLITVMRYEQGWGDWIGSRTTLAGAGWSTCHDRSMRGLQGRAVNHCEACEQHRSECGTAKCSVLAPGQVASDMAKLHAILDYVLSEDPRASIQIRRGRDNEFMMQVECDDSDVADRINFSCECNLPGIWFGASPREHPEDVQHQRHEAQAKTKPELTLGQFLLSAPRCDEPYIERSRELPRPDPFAEIREGPAESPARQARGPISKLESLARDYLEGRADAAELLAESEAAQMDPGPEDD